MNRHLMRLAVPIVIVASALGFATSCSRSSKDRITVGAVLNVSGPLATIGEPTRWALEKFRDAYNSDPGRKRELHLLIEDAKSNNNEAKPALESLLNSGSSPSVIVTSTSGTTMAMLTSLEKSNAVVIANAGHPGILESSNPNIILAFPAPQDECNEILAAIGGKTAFLIRANDPYHDVDALLLQKRLQNRLLADERFGLKDADFSNIVARIRATKPNFIVVMGVGVNYDHIFRALVDRNIRIPVIVDTDFMSNDPQQSYPREILPWITFVGTAYLRGDGQQQNPAIQRFLENYRKAYQRPPMYYAAMLIDTLYMVVRKIEDGMPLEQIVSSMANEQSVSLASGLMRIESRQVRLQLKRYSLNENGAITDPRY